MRKLILGHLVYLYTPLGVLACALGILKGGNWVWLGVAIFAASIIIDTVTAPLHLRGAAASKERVSGGKCDGPELDDVFHTLRLRRFAARSCLARLPVRGWRADRDDDVERVGIYQWHKHLGAGWCDSWRGHASGSRHHLWARAFPHQGHWIRDFPHDDGVVGHCAFLLRACLQPPSGLGRAWLGPENNAMGDDTDPATSPRGRSIYTHFIVSHAGQSFFGIRTEGKRLKRMGKSFMSLSNRWNPWLYDEFPADRHPVRRRRLCWWWTLTVRSLVFL